ncbi:MAG: flagellar basal body P-ring formation chaperone FlgA [Donghicola eburneus]|nr:flagellar basal body P-ring formation chaperone FlgA [Donghicola eburneus]
MASRTLPARTIITETDITIAAGDTAGAATAITDVLGKETRATIYSGRPLFLSALSEPALIERNQFATLVYELGALTISAEGRAMERGAAGALVRVMNLSSRTIVQGTVQPDATISVSGSR